MCAKLGPGLRRGSVIYDKARKNTHARVSEPESENYFPPPRRSTFCPLVLVKTNPDKPALAI